VSEYFRAHFIQVGLSDLRDVVLLNQTQVHRRKDNWQRALYVVRSSLPHIYCFLLTIMVMNCQHFTSMIVSYLVPYSPITVITKISLGHQSYSKYYWQWCDLDLYFFTRGIDFHNSQWARLLFGHISLRLDLHRDLCRSATQVPKKNPLHMF